ncbi:collagen alpha-2(I) chain-like [Motacilla alba alba]|uniref:collagen alpha-2(I) chain-like n=1 Tax=Motacilla alba alba TaxID=1094192 RepID=UPI0018D4DB41|nr:collagen alpha-2(I) chain-like [Motacilla alba alba]
MSRFFSRPLRASSRNHLPVSLLCPRQSCPSPGPCKRVPVESRAQPLGLCSISRICCLFGMPLSLLCSPRLWALTGVLIPLESCRDGSGLCGDAVGLLAPAGARCVCQGWLSQLAGTAGTAAPLPPAQPGGSEPSLQEGAGLCQEEARPQRSSLQPCSPARGCQPCQGPGGTAARHTLCPCPPELWEELGSSCPELGEGQRGRARGGDTDWPERGQGWHRQGDPGLGRGLGLLGQPWGGTEHSSAPAGEATAGNKPPGGFGIKHFFSKGTGRRFYISISISIYIYEYKAVGSASAVTQIARVLTQGPAGSRAPLPRPRCCCGRCSPACTAPPVLLLHFQPGGTSLPAGLHHPGWRGCQGALGSPGAPGRVWGRGCQGALGSPGAPSRVWGCVHLTAAEKGSNTCPEGWIGRSWLQGNPHSNTPAGGWRAGLPGQLGSLWGGWGQEEPSLSPLSVLQGGSAWEMLTEETQHSWAVL